MFAASSLTDAFGELEDANEPGLARKWVDLVVSTEGQRVLEKWGFKSAA